MTKKKSHNTNRLTLMGLCISKANRFKDDVTRARKHTNITPQWLYNRIKKLLIPGNYVSCETCGMAQTFEALTIDHKVPRSNHSEYNGNIHNTENLELICPSCNSMKGQKTLSEFLKFLEDRNTEIMKLVKAGKGGIVAPMFPRVGIGKKLFNDHSEKKYNGNGFKP